MALLTNYLYYFLSFSNLLFVSANKFVEWILPYDGEFENESDIIELLQRINSKVNQAPNQATNIPPILLFQKEKELIPLFF